MHRLLFAILFPLVFAGSLSAQISDDEIAGIKVKLRAAKNDSARLTHAFQLANGYRFYNVDSSLYYSDVALGFAEKLKDLRFKAAVLSLKGATVLENGRLPESLQLQFDALSISQKLKDTSIVAYALNRIGNTYMELADFKKANEYYFRSKDLFQVIRDSAMYYNEISNIGNIYEMMGMPDSALYYQQLVYNASYRNPTDRVFVTWGEMMFRMGNAYKLKGDREKAMQYYKQGIIESKTDNDIRNLTMNNLFLAKLYEELNLPDSSMKYAYDAIATGKAVSFRKGVYDASILLSTLFDKRNLHDSAYKYLALANVEKDSLIGVKRFQELQRIVLDEQERQRKAEVERIATRNKQKQLALIAGLAIFLIIASILYFNNKQKQKTNRVLEKTLANLKSTQSQLIQSEKMASLGELTAGIAHEIQNPLNFVNNFSEVNKELIEEMNGQLAIGNLQEAKQIGTDIKENEEKINHHGKRADAIVKNMLLHSRTGTGKKEPTDINALVDEYLRLAFHGQRAKDKMFNVKLETALDPTLAKINVIPQDIGRVLLNLINNAFFAVEQRSKKENGKFEPTVKVSSRKAGDTVELTITDNGEGIPDIIKDKIFQPFFTTKAPGQGTGLGLSLSYDILKAHGGELKVESTEGEGSSFTISLY